MFRQEKSPQNLPFDFSDDPRVLAKAEMIEFAESCIDQEQDVMLITWSPDPKQMPDADFNIQHQMHINLLSDYLKTCHCGLFCVESTELGNPHYHGWYQRNPKYELARIAIMKTMQRFGNVKPSKASHYRINSYTKGNNALYYYKKDVFDEMLGIDPNPLCFCDETSLNVDVIPLINFFTKPKKYYGKPTINEFSAQSKDVRRYYEDTVSYVTYK